MRVSWLVFGLLLALPLAAEETTGATLDQEFLEFLGEWDEFEENGLDPLQIDEAWLNDEQQAEEENDD